jgi:hypothetical protein
LGDAFTLPVLVGQLFQPKGRAAVQHVEGLFDALCGPQFIFGKLPLACDR